MGWLLPVSSLILLEAMAIAWLLAASARRRRRKSYSYYYSYIVSKGAKTKSINVG